MLDATTQAAIGRRLRAESASRPKGPIPDRLWRLLLAFERAESASSGTTPAARRPTTSGAPH